MTGSGSRDDPTPPGRPGAARGRAGEAEPADTSTVSFADTGADTEPSRPQPGVGDTAQAVLALPGRFEVKGRLGRGGMAVVLHVHDIALGRDVAVKLLAPTLRWDKTLRARFLREARAAATVRHPGLVTVHDIDPEGRFIVMELVRGESLKDRIARGPLAPAEVRRIGRVLCEALAAAHAAGVIHRDVKPGNVLLGEGGEVKLADFGIASFGDSDLTTTGSHIGTPAYMPPEQLRGRTVGPRADVYAAGATLFEAATGRRLHAVTESVEDPAAVLVERTGDGALARAIAQAVRERAEERYETALAFAAALAAESPALAPPDAGASSASGPLRLSAPGAVPGAPTPEPSGPQILSQSGAVPLSPGAASATSAAPGANAGPHAAAPPPRVAGARSRLLRTGLALGLTGGALGAAIALVWLALEPASGRSDPADPDATGDPAAPGASTAAPGDPSAPPSVALLPFADRTGDARLDFASAGLPHLLEMELRRHAPAVPVLGYYRLLERVSGPGAAPADWLAAAGALGAGITVRGELRPGPSGVHVTIALAAADGAAIASLARDTSAEGVPEAVRALAAEVASQLVGRAVSRPGALPRTLDLERRIHLGVAALERHDLEAAEVELESVVADAPGLVEAHYWLAMARWWRAADRADVLSEVEAALAGDVSEPQRGFLEGLRLLVDWRTDEAITHFRAVAARFPRDRDVLYGLVEALYHGGRPAEAVSVYRSMAELSPRFRLGLVHVLTYYTARTDEEGMDWALARADVVGEPPREIWAAKMHVSRGDVPAALDLLRRVSAGSASPSVARLAEIELTRVLAIDGQIDLSLALVRRLYEATPMAGILEMRGLHHLRGDEREATRWRELARREAAGRRPGFPRVNAWIEILLLDPPDTPVDAADEIDRALDDVPDDVRRMEFWQLARAFLAGARGDSARLDALHAGGHPEVAGVAEAHLAERAGDLPTAARALERAIAAAGNGRFLSHEHHALARVRRAAGDHAGVIAACREVLLPRLFDWASASRVPPCLVWTAESATALGRPDEARAAWKRLVALRAAAPRGDPYLKAARAALAALEAGHD